MYKIIVIDIIINISL